MKFLRSILTEQDMAAALAERRKGLSLLQEEVEHDVGLTHGHLGKIEAGGKKWGKRPFRVYETGEDSNPANPVSATPTLFWLMQRYRLRLVLVDEETAESLGPDVAMNAFTHQDKETRRVWPVTQKVITVMRRR